VKVQLLLEMATLEKDQSNYSLAEQHLQDALDLLQEEPEHPLMGRVLSVFAILSHEQSLFDQAFTYYHRALDIVVRFGKTTEQGLLLSNLAGLYKNIGDRAKAIELYQKGLQLMITVDDQQNIGVIRANLGALYREQGELQLAVEEYKKALILHEQVGHQRFVGIVYGELGEAFYALGEFEQAQESFQKSIEICDENCPIASILFRATLALMRSEMGDMEQAYQLLVVDEQLISSNPLIHAKFLCRKAAILHQEKPEEALLCIENAEKIVSDLQLQRTSELSTLLQQTKKRCRSDSDTSGVK